MNRFSVVLIGFLALTPVGTATSAHVTPAEYREAGITLPVQAALPFSPIVTDTFGKHRRLGDLVRRPTVLIFADFTCRTLCGPILAFVVSALEQSGLRPGSQFQLLVVGLDPKDHVREALAMRNRQIAADSSLAHATTFVTTDEAGIKNLTDALGYRYDYDTTDDSYVHPAAFYVLRADGRVSRVLAGIGLSARDLRLALVEASEGKIGSFGDRVRLLCSGFDPTHGTYNLTIGRLLALAAATTAVVLAGGIVILLLAGRRSTARQCEMPKALGELPRQQEYRAHR